MSAPKTEFHVNVTAEPVSVVPGVGEVICAKVVEHVDDAAYVYLCGVCQAPFKCVHSWT